MEARLGCAAMGSSSDSAAPCGRTPETRLALATSKQKKTKKKKGDGCAKPERPPFEGGCWVKAAGGITGRLRERTVDQCGRKGVKEPSQVLRAAPAQRGKASRAPPGRGAAGGGARKNSSVEPDCPPDRSWQLGEDDEGKEANSVQKRNVRPASVPGVRERECYCLKECRARKLGARAAQSPRPFSARPPMRNQAACRRKNITSNKGARSPVLPDSETWPLGHLTIVHKTTMRRCCEAPPLHARARAWGRTCPLGTCRPRTPRCAPACVCCGVTGGLVGRLPLGHVLASSCRCVLGERCDGGQMPSASARAVPVEGTPCVEGLRQRPRSPWLVRRQRQYLAPNGTGSAWHAMTNGANSTSICLRRPLPECMGCPRTPWHAPLGAGCGVSSWTALGYTPWRAPASVCCGVTRGDGGRHASVSGGSTADWITVERVVVRIRWKRCCWQEAPEQGHWQPRRWAQYGVTTAERGVADGQDECSALPCHVPFGLVCWAGWALLAFIAVSLLGWLKEMTRVSPHLLAVPAVEIDAGEDRRRRRRTGLRGGGKRKRKTSVGGPKSPLLCQHVGCAALAVDHQHERPLCSPCDTERATQEATDLGACPARRDAEGRVSLFVRLHIDCFPERRPRDLFCTDEDQMRQHYESVLRTEQARCCMACTAADGTKIPYVPIPPPGSPHQGGGPRLRTSAGRSAGCPGN